MSRSRWIKMMGIVVAFVAFASLTQATLALVVDPGLQFLGQWNWNYATTSIVKVRVKNVSCGSGIVLVEVKARAEDGSTVQGSVRIPLAAGAGREVQIPLSKRITSLQFTQLRFSPANGGAPQLPPCEVECPWEHDH